ncbi:hypothetical protein IIC38_02670 [candidate division KSB1 bacterium]|nr:hypothetical protein [candidate division KSB1 bacterium]
MNKQISLLLKTVAFLLLLAAVSHAQMSLQGGRGLLRIQDGGISETGDLYLSAFGSTFFEKPTGSSSLAKNYHLTLNFTYGLSHFLEIYGRLVPYQDDQSHIWGPIGDTELGFKLRVPFGSERNVRLSLRNYFILPTGVNHNLEYEPYTSGKFGWSPGATFSLNLEDNFFVPLKLYLNGGYIDRDLGNSIFSARDDQIYLGVGLKVLVRNTIFFWEYYTEQFSNRKEKIEFKENYQVSTLGFSFLGPYNLILTTAFDISLAKPTERTFFVDKKLADWKIWIGITKYIPLKKMFNEISDRKRRENELKEELKKQQMIKQKRTEADEELKKMQEELKKKKKNKDKKNNGQ